MLSRCAPRHLTWPRSSAPAWSLRLAGDFLTRTWPRRRTRPSNCSRSPANRNRRAARLAVPALSSRYRQARPTAQPHEVVEVVTTEATLRRWEQLQRSARHEVRSFDRPPYGLD